MDRVIVAGSGGSGKTILALQHGAAASVGVHPFRNDRYDPQRVLWIDLEMPDYLANDNLELVLRTGAAVRQSRTPRAGSRCCTGRVAST